MIDGRTEEGGMIAWFFNNRNDCSGLFTNSMQTWTILWKSEMVVFPYIRDPFEVPFQKGHPVVNRNDYSVIMSPHELGFVDTDTAGVFNHARQFVQRWRICHFVSPLDHPKATIRAKLGVASNEERIQDCIMKVHQNSPHQVPHKIIVFILSRAIVGIEMHIGLPQSMMCKIVMNVTYCCIRSFSSWSGLVN